MAFCAFALMLTIATSMMPNTASRAVPDRRLKNEGATHLKNAFLLPHHTAANIHLPKATELILESFNVDHWNEGFFSKLDQTKYLTILYGIIPRITFKSASLESLAVVQANLTTFEVSPEENSILRTLQLSRNRLSSLPADVSLLVGLITLDLSQNDLEHIDLNWFSTMKALKNLDLSVNKIAAIDASSDLELGRVKNLWVSYNNLQEFDAFPRVFSTLETVRLIGNRWSCGWVSKARQNIMERRIVTYGVDYGCGEHRQGGLCCYGQYPSTTEENLLREGPLVGEIQKLTNDLAAKPLDMSGEQSLELLTQNGGKDLEKILVGVKHDQVKVFF